MEIKSITTYMMFLQYCLPITYKMFYCLPETKIQFVASETVRLKLILDLLNLDQTITT
jgi:hypothetical protein